MKDLIVYVAERLAFFPFIVILLYILWYNIKSIIESNQEADVIDDKEAKKMINDEMYETCKDCPYYYGEVDWCMYGEEGVPNNLEKKCNEGAR